MRVSILICFSTLLLLACNDPKAPATFDPSTVKPTILKLHDKWREGAQQKNLSVISSIYAPDAHYVADGRHTRHGLKAIEELWAEDLKELNDVRLNMETLEGTRDILYETGTGYSLVVNKEDKIKLDTFHFKYVNVWRLQKDGSYKCVIDTYNTLPAQ